jgi:hypothetical protein
MGLDMLFKGCGSGIDSEPRLFYSGVKTNVFDMLEIDRPRGN